MAIYAATLPTRRRRELYAAFLRGVEGDDNRREALEQANSQMPGDVPAILKKVYTYRAIVEWSVCALVPFVVVLFFAKDPRVVRHLANLGTSRPELLNVGVFESARNETSKSGLVMCIFATTNLFLCVCWELATDFQTAVET